MPKIIPITKHFAVSGALSRDDVAQVRALGFASIVSNLPDGESAAWPGAAEEEALAAAAGLGFRHIPTTKFDVFSERVIGGTELALTELGGPVLAHCASGMRSAAAWAGAAARHQPAHLVLEVLRRAGFDFAPLRDELEAQYGKDGAGPIPAALVAAPRDSA